MKVALVTCSPFPPDVVDDEEPLREAFTRRGVGVLDVAWDADFDWRSVEAALLRTPWDYQQRAESFLAWCERAGRMTRLFNTADVVRWNLDKRYLAELASEDVPVAETVWLERDFLASHEGPGALAEELARTLGERGWPAAFLKPVVGANAWLTHRFAADPSGCARAAAHLLASPRDMMLQPYLERVETVGELSLIWVARRVPSGVGSRAGRFTHAVQKVPARGDYRVQEDWGARDLPWSPDARALEIAHAAIDAAERNLFSLLYARVDLLEPSPGEYVVNELELVEPAMFFRRSPAAAEALAEAMLARL